MCGTPSPSLEATQLQEATSSSAEVRMMGIFSMALYRNHSAESDTTLYHDTLDVESLADLQVRVLHGGFNIWTKMLLLMACL